MRWHRFKVLLGMLLVVTITGFIIFIMSSRIQLQMEIAASENVREMVKIIESGISEIRRNDIALAQSLALVFPTDGDIGESLHKLSNNSPFSKISYVPNGASTGISSDGSEFFPEKLPPLERLESVTQVYMSGMGAWAYTIETPVYREGMLVGTLYADIIMERYDNILPNSIYQEDGLVYLLDSNTLRFIYEPTSTSVFISSKYNLHGFLDDFGILDQELEQNLNKAIMERKSTIARMWVDGKDSYIYFWPIDSGAWYLCGLIPESSIQGESKAVSQTIAATSFCIFISAILILGLLYWNIRESQKARQYQITLFHEIAKRIDDAVLLYSVSTGRLELAFDNIYRILGIDAKELETLAEHADCLEEGVNDRLLTVLRPETFRTKTEFSEELQWDNPVTGERQCLKIETSYIMLNRSPKCILSIRDVTKDEQMRESLRASVMAAQKASRVKSDFLSRMSHEIRTPMNAIVGMTQIAEAKWGNWERVYDCLKKIKASSKHLLGLINDILDISRIESQKMSLSENWFSVNELLTGISDIITVQASLRNQTFLIENQAGPIELLADRVRMSQVMVNLLNNSVKYTQEGGQISFKIEREDIIGEGRCYLRFQIKDNGIGMSDEFQKKLFIPFEREDDQAVHAQTGTGLGLAIVQNIVSLMGGSIRVESKKGAGTTFFVDFVLQYHLTLQEDNAEPEQETCDLSGMKILLVEDNELNREIAEEFLLMANAGVECAVDGLDAYEKFRDSEPGRYDLILMDMQMPRWDGLYATQQIRALDRIDAKDIPIIAVTANAYLEDGQRCLEAGMNDRVTKPLDIKEFYQKVKRYL